MNCAECRENLVACVEGLLDREESLQCQAHLETCAACRAEHAAIIRLQRQLAARGPATAGVSLVNPVMRRVQAMQTERERDTIMTKLFTRWGFGLSAAAGATAIILIAFLVFPKAKATAAEVMTKGAQAVAKLTSIHFRGQVRSGPADNFGSINPNSEFYAIELWKQFDPDLKWRVEKPEVVVVMDGKSTVIFNKSRNVASKRPQPSSSAFDTDWLHRIANLGNTISNELNNAQTKGWKLETTEETAANGRMKAIVTIHTKSGLPDDDYMKNKFIGASDTRRVYHFDAQSDLLEAVQVYLVRPSGEVLIFELSQIDYNQPIEPSVWQLELPADVNWSQEPQKLPDNEKYASMTAEQAARAFLEACAHKDWNEAGKFMSPITDFVKEYLGGLEIVSLGESFTSKAYGGRYVPYEIKLQPLVLNVRVSNTNAAKRCVVTGIYDSKLRLLQDIKWSTEPEVLTNNDAYAGLSPKEAAQAYFDAQSKLDWVEMRKFTSESDVEETKGEVAMAEKQGIDVHKHVPVVEVVEATWSAEQSAWFVKYRMLWTKQWNLAIRKDNPAGRWQVDGGL
jgi:outer membrane lipoprotein-sorting protein